MWKLYNVHTLPCIMRPHSTMCTYTTSVLSVPTLYHVYIVDTLPLTQ